MKAHELLAELRSMEITSASVESLARRVSEESIAEIVELKSDIIAAAAARALEIHDVRTMAGLMTIIYACGIETTMQVANNYT